MTIKKDKKVLFGVDKLRKLAGPTTFGRLLLIHRKLENISQTTLAKKLGLSRQNLCDLEKERKIPSPARAAKIAKKLGEIEHYWVQTALQDTLRRDKLKYIVKLEKINKAS